MATIQGVYVALFGRPADPTGLAYFKGVTQDGADLSAIGDLAGTAEYKARFEGQSNVQIVNSIYKSLFNRDADVAGLNFFVDALNKGALNINNIAIAILDGAQGADKTVVENKVKAADAFTAALDTAAEIVGYDGAAAAASARAWLAGVKDTAPTAAQIDAAVSAAVGAGTGGGSGTPGVILTLTNGADVFTPTAAADANKTTAGNDTIRGLIAADLGSTDIIDGGEGTDTLNAVFGVGAIGTPVIKSVEVLNFTGPGIAGTAFAAGAGAAGQTSGIDLSATVGAQQVTFSGVRLTADVTAAGVDEGASLSVSNASVSTVVGFKDILAVAGANATDHADIYAGFANVTGGNDSATVSINNIDSVANGVLNLHTAGIENLTITTSGGTAGASSFTLVDAQLKSLVLKGDSAVTLLHNAGNTAVKTVDASGLTAALNYTATGNGETITAGTKADTITFGTGNDVLVLGNSAKSTLDARDTINNFDFANDKINVAAFGFEAGQVVGATTLSPAGDTAGFFTETSRIILNEATDTLYIDVNKDGIFNATSDIAITITGATAANLTAADFIFA